MKGSFEEWVGRKAIGVIAAVLVFAGFGYLAAAFVPQLSDIAKVLIMFALSGTLFVSGALMSIRRRNGFTSALLGCGAVSLFISILATHLYFNMIGDVVAFMLMLVWLAGCLAVLRATRSLMLDIVMQLGLAASVLIGYSYSYDTMRLALLVGYQLCATTLVVGGNLMFLRKMYLPSLMLSLALSVLCGILVDGRVDSLFEGVPALELWPSAALLVQFVQATASAALIAASSLGEQSNSSPNTSHSSKTGVAAAASLLWLASIAFCVMPGVSRILTGAFDAQATQSLVFEVPYAIAAALIACAALLLAFKARSFGARMSGVCAPSMALRTMLLILALGGAGALMMRAYLVLISSIFPLQDDSNLMIGWMYLWACLALALGRMTKDSVHNNVAFGCVLAGMYWVADMTMSRMDQCFGNVAGFALCMALAAVSAVVCFATILVISREKGNESAASAGSARCTILVMAAECVLFMVPISSGFEFAAPAVCIAGALVIVVLRRALPRAIAWAYHRELFANELLVAGFTVLYMASARQSLTEAALFGIAAAIIAVLMVARIRRLPRLAYDARVSPLHSWNQAQLLLGTISLAVMLLAYVFGCTPFAAEGYLMSVYCMACAGMCVFTGFSKRCRPLHLAGLIASLACVAKLVLFDVQGLDSLTRFAAYIGGGLICFAVSAIYNRVLRAQDAAR